MTLRDLAERDGALLIYGDDANRRRSLRTAPASYC